jgi:protoporphyrinogen oxidase
MKKVIVIGAGPAGLTAAYELLSKSKDYEVVVLEESGCIGGISKTVNYKGNRMDMGGAPLL